MNEGIWLGQHRFYVTLRIFAESLIHLCYAHFSLCRNGNLKMLCVLLITYSVKIVRFLFTDFSTEYVKCHFEAMENIHWRYLTEIFLSHRSCFSWSKAFNWKGYYSEITVIPYFSLFSNILSIVIVTFRSDYEKNYQS